jgi:hypothetical protein
MNHNILWFDLSGNYLYSKKTDDIYYSRRIIQKNDTTYIAYNDVEELPKDYNLLELDSLLSIRHKSCNPVD